MNSDRAASVSRIAARRRRTAGLLLLVLPIGCDTRVRTDYAGLDLASVSGIVTLDGVPLYGATVQFLAPDQTYSVGRTDALGQYKLMFNSEQAGVGLGLKTVRILTAVSEGDGEDENEAVGDASAAELVPDCYHRHSGLTVEVRPGTQEFDFDLASDCSTTGASAGR